MQEGQRISMADEILEAKKKAMSLLEHMDRTEWQLRDKLTAKGFSEEAVESAVAYVKSFHYLDDLRFAMHFVEVYHEKRSIRRLRQDLYQRHVPEEYIETALDSVNRDDTEALRRELKKLTGGERVNTYEEKQKIAAKLYRKGFRTQDILRCLEE